MIPNAETVHEKWLLLKAKYDVAEEIIDERVKQDDKWGQQNHPDGTFRSWSVMADEAKRVCQKAAKEGWVTWNHILTEEYEEAMSETDPAKLRAELIQVAAVCAAWIECIDRRNA